MVERRDKIYTDEEVEFLEKAKKTMKSSFKKASLITGWSYSTCNAENRQVQNTALTAAATSLSAYMQVSETLAKAKLRR